MVWNTVGGGSSRDLLTSQITHAHGFHTPSAVEGAGENGLDFATEEPDHTQVQRAQSMQAGGHLCCAVALWNGE